MTEHRICINCSASFPLFKKPGPKVKRCPLCQATYRNAVPMVQHKINRANGSPCNKDHICKQCGKTFRPKRSNTVTCCSRECGFEYQKANVKPKTIIVRQPNMVDCLFCLKSFDSRN